MDEWTVPVVRIRAAPSTERDSWGEPIPGLLEREDLPPALFEPGTTSEPVTAGAAPVITSPVVYWRGKWPDVLPSDRLEVAGVEYRVESQPAWWPGGLAITLKGVHGK